jgi:hypothetical protein
MRQPLFAQIKKNATAVWLSKTRVFERDRPQEETASFQNAQLCD